MSGLWTSPAGPLVVLTIGALVLILGSRFLPERWRTTLPAWLAGISLLSWALLRFFPEREPGLWAWQPPLGLHTAVGFQLDGWAWVAGLGIGLIAFVAVALPGWRWRPGFVDPRYWSLLITAAALLVILSDTWISLLGAWTFMVLILGLVAGEADAGSSRAWSVGILSTLLLMATPLFNGGNSLEAPLAGQQLNAQAQLLLALAAVIHIAAYPFHLWLTPKAPRSPGRHLVVHLVPGLAALHLLGLFDLPLLASQAWVPLGVFALLGSALAAWADQDNRRSWAYVLINRSTWAVLALGLTRLSHPANAVFPLVTLALGGALWAVARVAQWHFRWNLPLILSVAVLYGLPFTPGFAPNLVFGQLSGSIASLPAWLLVMLAQTLFVAAMLQRPQPKPDEPDASPALPTRAIAVTFVLIVALVLWWGLFPSALARLTGLQTSGVFDSMLGQLRLAGWAGFITLFLPFILGIILALSDERLFGTLRGWQTSIARIAGLGWLYGGAGRVLHGLATFLGTLADLIDGAGQFGWVLLAILIAWILFGG